MRQNTLRQVTQTGPGETTDLTIPQSRCNIVRELSVGPAAGYNEDAFQYFLADERQRTDHSKRASLLVLVDLEPAGVTREHDRSQLLQEAFARLSLCLRETDIVGWYREGRVVGAVLTDVADPLTEEALHRIEERLGALIRDGVPVPAGAAVRVRVVALSQAASVARTGTE